MQHDPRRGPGATRRYFAPEIIEAIAMFEEPGNECRFGDHGYDVQGRIKLIAHESGQHGITLAVMREECIGVLLDDCVQRR